MSTITSIPPKHAASPRSQSLPLQLPGEKRIAIHGVTWDLYERLSDAIGQRQRVFLAYDGKDLEIMVKGPTHENYRFFFGKLVDAITEDLRIQYSALGETTWMREALEKGLEADQCYFFLEKKLETVAEAFAQVERCRGLSQPRSRH